MPQADPGFHAREVVWGSAALGVRGGPPGMGVSGVSGAFPPSTVTFSP